MSLLKGEGVVVLAGLAVSHQVAGLLTQPEQRLCICSADCSMVPATVNNRKIVMREKRNKGRVIMSRKLNKGKETANVKSAHEGPKWCILNKLQS